jgi:hypothetical protein
MRAAQVLQAGQPLLHLLQLRARQFQGTEENQQGTTMTQKRIDEERAFAAQCMIDQFDEMLKAGQITQQRHDELVAKVNSVNN